MNLKLNSRAGLVGTLWLLIVLFIVFIIMIAGVFITMVRTIRKIVPPPPPDDDGTISMPGIGDKYAGGTVAGYVPPPHFSPQYLQDAAPPGFTVHRVYIFAADSPRPAAWTNCIWQGDLADVANAMGTNGLPLESWPVGQQPAARFYNIVVSNSNQ